MITATLKPLAVGRAALARQAKALQEMALALSHDPDIDRLLMIAADSNGQLAAFEEAGIHFTDIEPDAHLQHALQALTAAIIQVHVARPDMKLLPGLAGFLHQAECSRHVLANSTRTRDRVSAVAQWLNWQWAAPLEAEERQATGRPATLAELADRYGLREGGKEAGKILSLLWQQQITRHAAVLERSAPASALSTQGQQ